MYTCLTQYIIELSTGMKSFLLFPALANPFLRAEHTFLFITDLI